MATPKKGNTNNEVGKPRSSPSPVQGSDTAKEQSIAGAQDRLDSAFDASREVFSNLPAQPKSTPPDTSWAVPGEVAKPGPKTSNPSSGETGVDWWDSIGRKGQK